MFFPGTKGSFVGNEEETLANAFGERQLQSQGSEQKIGRRVGNSNRQLNVLDLFSGRTKKKPATMTRYDIERNGIGLGLTALAVSPLVLLMFSWCIEWWNR